MRIELICIGTELLSGKTNTHVSYFIRTLQAIGLTVSAEHTLPDSIPSVVSILRQSFKKNSLIIICGGLGPTFDDITREAVAQALGKKLIFNKKLFKHIGRRMHIYHKIPSSYEKRQALLIKGAVPIPNKTGIAPGQIIKDSHKVIFLLPGPLQELAPMVEHTMIPFIKKNIIREKCRSIHFNIFGSFEADIDHALRPLIKKNTSHDSCRSVFSIIADAGTVRVSVTVQGPHLQSVEQKLSRIKNRIYHLFGKYIFNEGFTSLEETVASLMRKNKKTVSVAESCTGGLLAAKLTSVSGSSVFFKQGLIVYSNESKILLLGIPPNIIKQEGAVSRTVARIMAEHVRRKAQTDYGISITGIAGPGGATKKKQVGLVYIGIAAPSQSRVEEFHFKGNRDAIRTRSVMHALNLLREKLINGSCLTTVARG